VGGRLIAHDFRAKHSTGLVVWGYPWWGGGGGKEKKTGVGKKKCGGAAENWPSQNFSRRSNRGEKREKEKKRGRGNKRRVSALALEN